MDAKGANDVCIMVGIAISMCYQQVCHLPAFAGQVPCSPIILLYDNLMLSISNCTERMEQISCKIWSWFEIERCLREVLPWTPESQYAVPTAEVLHASEGMR